MGGEDITNALIGAVSTDESLLTIDRDYAERLKIDVGVPDENTFTLFEGGISNSQLSTLMTPTLERLVVQIQRTFDYYRSKFPFGEPDKIYLSGGTANMKNFPSYLAEGLGKEVIVINPFEFIKVSEKINQEELKKAAPYLTVAFGTAIDEKKGLNLLPPEIKIIPLIEFQKRIFKFAFVFILFSHSFLCTIPTNFQYGAFF